MEIKNRSSEEWVPPIDKYYNIENDAYKLVFDQAKDRFEDIMKESESITDKSLKMLAWLGALAGFCVGVLFQQKASNPALLLALPFFAAEVVFLLILISPKEIRNRGLSPKAGIPDKLDMEEKEYQLRLVYMQHIIILQDNITFMRKKNQERIIIYRWAQILMIVLVAAVTATITTLLGKTFR